MHNNAMPATFLISYDASDQGWAEWIAWQLEAAGYSTRIRAWDMRPGMNTTLEMDRAIGEAQHIIAVLSPAYLAALSTQPEWSAALTRDPAGATRALQPVRVHECQPNGLLATLDAIDLAGLSQDAAREKLLAGVAQGRAKPASEPHFPGSAAPAFPAAWPEFWLVPYNRNPFFTDRERLLKALYKQLARQKRSQQATALTQQAISGLGGIGKTQTALEYAYRYRHEYRYVLWANASSAENLLNDYVKFAATLHIPNYDAQDQRTALPAVKAWLGQQRDWLLILDNADDLSMIQDYLPTDPRMRGHILLTTRASAGGPLVQAIEVAKMDRRDGVELLLKRSGVLTSNRSSRTALTKGQSKEQRQQARTALRSAAETLVEQMDGLPLAIDLAAGYIKSSSPIIHDIARSAAEKHTFLLRTPLSPVKAGLHPARFIPFYSQPRSLNSCLMGLFKMYSRQ